MSLQQLRTFLEAYRQGSLTEAANRLSLSQPAVSQQIASLETRLGRKLFERARRGIRPLPAADDLAAALGSSLDDAEAVLATALARSRSLSGVVHIAGPAEYLGCAFGDALALLASSGLQLRIQLGGRDAIYSRLLAGDVDLAVTASRPDHKQLDHHQIAAERLRLVRPADFPASQDVGDLVVREPYVAYDADLPLIRQWCTANSLPLPERRPAVTIPDLRALVSLVASGAGWSVLPDYLVEDRSGLGLHVVDTAHTPVNALFLAWARGALRHPRIAYARDILLARR
jgi:DNA-binding transcriptional LysR family regulator